MLKKIALLTAVGVALGLSPAAQAFLIDGFTDADADLVEDDTGTGDSVIRDPLIGTNIVDGIRDMSILRSGSGAAAMYADARKLTISQNTGASAVSTIKWTAGIPTGPSSMDLSPSGENVFVFDLVDPDTAFPTPNTFSYTLTVRDTGNNEAAYSSGTIQTSTPTTYLIPFSSFTSVNFGLVKWVELVINGSEDLDIAIGPFRSAVPEPGTLALLSLGLAGVGAAVRRRRRQD